MFGSKNSQTNFERINFKEKELYECVWNEEKLNSIPKKIKNPLQPKGRDLACSSSHFYACSCQTVQSIHSCVLKFCSFTHFTLPLFCVFLHFFVSNFFVPNRAEYSPTSTALDSGQHLRAPLASVAPPSGPLVCARSPACAVRRRLPPPCRTAPSFVARRSPPQLAPSSRASLPRAHP